MFNRVFGTVQWLSKAKTDVFAFHQRLSNGCPERNVKKRMLRNKAFFVVQTIGQPKTSDIVSGRYRQKQAFLRPKLYDISKILSNGLSKQQKHRWTA